MGSIRHADDALRFVTKAKDARGLETYRAGSGNRFLLYHHCHQGNMPKKKNDTRMQNLTVTPAPRPEPPESPDPPGDAGTSTPSAPSGEQSGSQTQTPEPQPQEQRPQGMSGPVGGYPETSNIGRGGDQAEQSQEQTQEQPQEAAGEVPRAEGQSTPSGGAETDAGTGDNSTQSSLPNGAAVRQGPKGPMHKHPGYQDAAGHLKWHPVSQKHGRGTAQMHEQAGLGRDGLGSTPEMRMAVGANMSEGGGLMEPPKTGTQVASSIAAHAGLTALEALTTAAGKGMSAVTNFTRAVLSGNPLSPASSMLADTFDAMGSVKRSIDSTYEKYGIDPGADMASVQDTIRGRLASRQVEAQNTGYNRALDNIDSRAMEVMGYGHTDGTPPDLTEMGPAQLDLYYQTLSEDADNLLREYNDARERGTLTPEMQRAYDAEIEVYASAFGAIAQQGEANKKKYQGLAKELRAQRASERAKAREAQEQAKRDKEAKNNARYVRAMQSGDYATQVFFEQNPKNYDAEVNQDGVPINPQIRSRYMRTLQDKIESQQYTDAENASMQARLDACREYTRKKKFEEKQEAHRRIAENDYSGNINLVDTVLNETNALGRDGKVNQYGVVEGDKLSPKTGMALRNAAERRVRALTQREMDIHAANGNPISEAQARQIAEQDTEYRRAMAASYLEDWTYDRQRLESELTHIPYQKLLDRNKTLADVDQAQRDIRALYDEMASQYSINLDDFQGDIPTEEDRARFKQAVDVTRRDFGIWRPKKEAAQTPPTDGKARVSLAEPEPESVPENLVEPTQLWVQSPNGMTPTGQRIQFGKNTQEYSPDEINITAGRTLQGQRTYAQSLMVAKFRDDNPNANANYNMSKPSIAMREQVMNNWPAVIEEMQSSNDPMKAEVAKEMSKYLNFTRETEAWAQFIREAPAGSDERKVRKREFENYLSGMGSDWANYQEDGINLDDMASVEENLQDLRDTYAPFEDEGEDEDELNLDDLSDEELDSKLDELYELANAIADEAGDDPTDEQTQQYDEYVSYINAFEAELARRKGETDDSDEETVEETDESDEADEESDEIPPDEAEIDENQGKPLVVGKGNRLPDDLAEWYMGLDVDFEDYSDEELAEIGWNASKELTDMLNGAKPVPPSEVENTNVPPELRQRYEDLYHTAKTASNILTERKNRVETPEIPEKTDEKEVVLPKFSRYKRDLTRDQLLAITTPEQMLGLNISESCLADESLSISDLETIASRYHKVIQKLIQDGANSTVADKEGKLSPAKPELKKRLNTITTRWNRISKEVGKRKKAQRREAELKIKVDNQRKKEERELERKSQDALRDAIHAENEAKRKDAKSHTAPFTLEGLNEPQDVRWDAIRNETKDSPESAEAAMRYDPTGQDKPIIPEGVDIDSNSIGKTLSRMREATMSLRKYLAVMAQNAGDEDLAAKVYESDNPWEVVGDFVSKYGENSPEAIKDLMGRVDDSYDVIRVQFKHEVNPAVIAKNLKEQERKNNQANRTNSPPPSREPLEDKVQKERLNSAGAGVYANVEKLANNAIGVINKKGLEAKEANDRRVEIISARNEAQREIGACIRSDLPYEEKMEQIQAIADKYEGIMDDFIAKSFSLDDIDFSVLPDELQKAFRSEFNHMRVLLAGYACMYPNIVPGHTVESTVDIMLRHPETLEKSHREYAEDNLSLFRDRVETMLYEYLTTL